MILNLKMLTPPAHEPLTLAQVKQHCRVTIADDDSLLSDIYMPAARELCENEMKRAIYAQTWQLTLDHFPLYPWWNNTQRSTSIHEAWHYSTFWKAFRIKLPRPSLVSVSSISYLDMAGNEQTVNPATYKVDTDGTPGCVVPVYGKSWPYADAYLPDSVKITYVAGSYGDGATVDTCPKLVKAAVLLLAAHLYENKSATTDLKLIELPIGVTRLLTPYKVTVMGYEEN